MTAAAVRRASSTVGLGKKLAPRSPERAVVGIYVRFQDAPHLVRHGVENNRMPAQ